MQLSHELQPVQSRTIPATECEYSESVKELAYWLDKLITQVPENELELSAVWARASKILYSQIVYPTPIPDFDPQRTKDILKTVAQRRIDKVLIVHRKCGQMHSLEKCNDQCFAKSRDYYYFLNNNNLSLGYFGTLYIYFQSKYWEEMVDVLAELVGKEEFFPYVREAKIVNRTIDSPAIVYLHNPEIKRNLTEFLKTRLCGKVLMNKSLPGSNTIYPWLYITEQRPDANGCQPESRADILTRAFHFKTVHRFSLEKSIAASADYLGYIPNAPHKLKPTTESLRQLVEYEGNHDTQLKISNEDKPLIKIKIREQLSLYGYIPAFSLNSFDSGPWMYRLETTSMKKERCHSISTERLCVSIQLNSEKIEEGLCTLLESIEDLKNLGDVRIGIRDPDSKYFLSEAVIIELNIRNNNKEEILSRLKKTMSMPKEYLSNNLLPALNKEGLGIYSTVRRDAGNIFPTFHELLHEQILLELNNSRFGVSPEIVMRSLLFAFGKNTHDPHSTKNPIIRPLHQIELYAFQQ